MLATHLERDLKTFAELGRALWPDPSRSGSITVETLSAIFSLDLTAERAFERASAALLDRATKQGVASGTRDAIGLGVFDLPFFRLHPNERFLLTALHLGRWSYERASRVMGQPVEQIERAAWKARVRLASAQRLHPVGAKLASVNCPEYDLDRPWTQRFLDEEIRNGTELVFLQNHLMACDSCRHALNRCRDLYFTVEKMLPKVEARDRLLLDLGKVCVRGRDFREKRVSFSRSLLGLLRKTDVQLILAVGLFCLFAAIARWIRG